MRLYWRALLVATTAVALASGCSSGGGDNAADRSSRRGGTEDKYSSCLRQHGVDPNGDRRQVDGGQGSGAVTETAPPGDDQGKQQKAQAACRQFLPNGGVAEPMDPAQLEQARAIAKCMRAAGVDYPDPDPNAANQFGGGNGGVAMPVPSGVNLSDPVVQAEFDKCFKDVVGDGAGAGATPGGAGR